MTKEEKHNEIKILTKDLSEASNFYLADIAGLDSKSTLDLRRACFKSNISGFRRCSNTFLKGYDSGGFKIKVILKVIIVSFKSEITARGIEDFRKKSDKPILKGAFIDESIYIGDDKIDVLADLKSKDELIGEILTLLSSPLTMYYHP